MWEPSGEVPGMQVSPARHLNLALLDGTQGEQEMCWESSEGVGAGYNEPQSSPLHTQPRLDNLSRPWHDLEVPTFT